MGEMKVLLDTHTLLWWLFGDKRLSKRVHALLRDVETQTLISSASGWEIATKYRLGRIPEAAPFVQNAGNILQTQRMSVLPVSLTHAIAAGLLKYAHRDPFDRMLAAQSQIENIPLVTNDKVFRPLGLEMIW